MQDLTKTKPTAILTDSCKLTEQPQMQVRLAGKIFQWMNLALAGAQAKDMAASNFENPQTILLVGKSILGGSYEESREALWQAVNGEPNSIFAVAAVLDFYAITRQPSKTATDTHMDEVMALTKSSYMSNSYVAAEAGQLLVQMQYPKTAEPILRALLERDPDMYWGHEAMSTVQWHLEKYGEAIKEAETLVRHWPTAPLSFEALAVAYQATADGARKGVYFDQMSEAARKVWEDNHTKALKVALAATKLDPDSTPAWLLAQSSARELDDKDTVDRAFHQLVRIDPKQLAVYTEYIYTYCPRWFDDSTKQQEAINLVEKAFGKSSWEPYYARAMQIYNEGDKGKYTTPMLQVLMDGIATSKTSDLGMLTLAYKTSMATGHCQEAIYYAELAYKVYQTADWLTSIELPASYQWLAGHEEFYLKKCLDAAQKWLAAAPASSEAHYQMGWIDLQYRKFDDARKEFELVKQINPSRARLQQRLDSLDALKTQYPPDGPPVPIE